LPAATVVGETERLDIVSASMNSGADIVKCPCIALMVVETLLVTLEEVLIVKVTLVAPAGTVTTAGTVTSVLFAEIVTTEPPAGAAEMSLTVPVAVPPAATIDGETVKLVIMAGWIVNVALRIVPPIFAVIVAATLAATTDVVIVKFAEFAPAGMSTFAGTTAELLLEDRFTNVPLGPAAELTVTVPVEEMPPINSTGLSESDVVKVGVPTARRPPELAILLLIPT